MDRMSDTIERATAACADDDLSPSVMLGYQDAELLDRAARRLAVPEGLLNLPELDVLYDENARTLWTFMRPAVRPSFTPAMLADFENWQALIARHFGRGRLPLDYLVLGSRSPGVFCYGGDLALFEAMIRTGDRDGLARYGHRCVEILHRNMAALDLPLLTIGLVQGDALGGGFESLLSFDVIVAEKTAQFGLPEVAFGLFPGMGAHAILARKLGTAKAGEMIRQNKTYSATELFDLGIVTHLAEHGEGLAVVRNFISKTGRKQSGLVAERRAMRLAAPLPLAELKAIVDVWADAALALSDADLKFMRRIADRQLSKQAA